MGAGIALVAARGGYIVELIEPDAGARERALARITKDAERAGDTASVSNIRIGEAIPERSEASIAIEAVVERFDVKRDVLARLARAVDRNALIATNTSALSVADLADTIEGPERVLGLHFFNPPVQMKLVEIVAAPLTSDDTLERARAFVDRIGKSAVIAADTPGFIVNRVARPYYLQSMRAFERGVAPMDDLDALARSIGFRMGPFELMDLIGLDVNLATTDSVYERLGAERLAPVKLQQDLVAEGRLGRKTGTGFYDYRQGEIERVSLVVDPATPEVNEEEFVAIVGAGGVADEIAELLEQRYANVQRIENDELLDELNLESTIVIDIGNGSADRGDVIAELDSLLGPETVFFVDAYATDLSACIKRMRHPDRLVGFGILGDFNAQYAAEIVDTPEVSDDALALAQELFATLGKGVVLLENLPGLYLGRVVCSIVNEAVTAVHEDVATPDDIDLAMRLGTNYPIGPIAWGREIGGARATRILRRLAEAEGDQFTPHRSLWVLDVEEEAASEP